MTLDQFDAVVFDLDGTLAILDVDWRTLREELATLLAEHGVDVGDTGDVWRLLDGAEHVGVGEEAHARIRQHEVAGAESSARLPLADRVAPLAEAGVPVGICSLNSPEAVRIALDHHGLARHVDAVGGREHGSPRKPDPEPLLDVVEALGATPDTAVFVGDSPGDEATAEAAGVAFRRAAALHDGYPESWEGVLDSDDAGDLIDELTGDDAGGSRSDADDA